MNAWQTRAIVYFVSRKQTRRLTPTFKRHSRRFSRDYADQQCTENSNDCFYGCFGWASKCLLLSNPRGVLFSMFPRNCMAHYRGNLAANANGDALPGGAQVLQRWKRRERIKQFGSGAVGRFFLLCRIKLDYMRVHLVLSARGQK
jgi:hypothetical protein